MENQAYKCVNISLPTMLPTNFLFGIDRLPFGSTFRTSCLYGIMRIFLWAWPEVGCRQGFSLFFIRFSKLFSLVPLFSHLIQLTYICSSRKQQKNPWDIVAYFIWSLNSRQPDSRPCQMQVALVWIRFAPPQIFWKQFIDHPYALSEKAIRIMGSLRIFNLNQHECHTRGRTSKFWAWPIRPGRG